MLVPGCCLVFRRGWGGDTHTHEEEKDEEEEEEEKMIVTRSGGREREMCSSMRGRWKEDSISSVRLEGREEEGEEEERGKGGEEGRGEETDGYGVGQTGGAKSVIESRGNREREA